MFKKVLMSSLALGALASMVGVGSYAAFTDSGTATGVVTGADIELKLDGNDNATFNFNPGNILPTETQTGAVTVTNSSNRAVHLTFGTPSVSSSDESNCPAGYLAAAVTAISDGPADDHDGNAHLAVGASETLSFSATLDANAPDPGCQGVTFDVAFGVTATGAPNE